MAPEIGAVQETLILVGPAAIATKVVGAPAAVAREGYSYVNQQPPSCLNFNNEERFLYRVHS